MPADLARCPVCGRRPKLSGPPFGPWLVRCSQRTSRVTHVLGVLYRTRDRAVAEWNKQFGGAL